MLTYQFNQNISGSHTNRVTGVRTPLNSAEIFGYKSFTNDAPNNNSSVVYLGVESGKLPFRLATGSSITLSNKDSLSNYWYRATSGDGIFVVIKF